MIRITENGIELYGPAWITPPPSPPPINPPQRADLDIIYDATGVTIKKRWPRDEK